MVKSSFKSASAAAANSSSRKLWEFRCWHSFAQYNAGKVAPVKFTRVTETWQQADSERESLESIYAVVQFMQL